MIDEIKNIVESFDVNFYDTQTVMENNHKIFRIFITSKDGISLEKCAEISRVISPILDLNPPISGNYFLEVSSPGIERKLKTLHHFKCSIGSDIKIKEYSTKILKGKLLDVSDDGIITIEDINNGKLTTKFDDILSSSTYFDWNK